MKIGHKCISVVKLCGGHLNCEGRQGCQQENPFCFMEETIELAAHQIDQANIILINIASLVNLKR